MHFPSFALFFVFVLFLLAVALQAADAFLTWRVLRAGGRELNPVIRFLIDHLGIVPGLAVAKLFLVVMMWLYLRDQLPALLAIDALYAWVVHHNWTQLQAAARKPSNAGIEFRVITTAGADLIARKVDGQLKIVPPAKPPTSFT